jgi:AcrR family transcriptional regulator
MERMAPTDPTTTANRTDGTRTRLSAEQRRRAILAAARTEFSRVGYHGASTASIAERAGCSEPMLYKHFRGKRELFIEALRESIEYFHLWFDTTVAADTSAPATDVARAAVVEQMRHPEFLQLLRLRMLAVTLVDDREVHDELLELDRATHERIAVFVQRAIDEGTVSPNTEPEYVAWAWTGFMLAACYREALEPGTFEDMSGVVGAYIGSLSPGPG